MNEICQDRIGRIDDLLDERLNDAERSELHAHLEGCTGCRAALEDAVRFRTAAKALPREISPRRDLWGGIAARIADASGDGAGGAEVIEIASRRTRRSWVDHPARLAAAAVLLVALTSAITANLVGSGSSAAPTAQLPAARVDGTTPATFAAFAPAEREYQATLETLEAEYAARKEALAPETVDVVERNLAIIDQAISEVRAALRADPGSAELPLHLSDVYRRKVEVLQSAIQI